jgi:hypothetical protein
MKEEITGILSIPYMDKLVIRIARQTDRFHVAQERVYTAHYSEPSKARHLMNHFLNLNSLLQAKIIEKRIERWNSES